MGNKTPGPDGSVIAHKLGTSVVGRSILYFDSLDSTNNYAKKLASEGCEDGTVVIAGGQTAGRGRVGRAWESPQDKGIYLTVVLKPVIFPEKIQLITLAASVAVAGAIKDACGAEAGIKWPNDILLDGKKVCGILTEINCERDHVNFVVVGMGINFSQAADDFPEALKKKAVSLSAYMRERGGEGGMPDRLAFIRTLLRETDKVYSLLKAGRGNDIIESWKRHSLTLGRQVLVNKDGGDFTGKAVDITDDGRLVVSCGDGTAREVLSGEISVRGLLDYI